MKSRIEQLLQAALETLKANDVLAADTDVSINVERARDKQHGDFATNLALALSKIARRKPRDLAELIIDALPASADIERVAVAGPGFINFFVTRSTLHGVVGRVLEQGDDYGCSDVGQGHPLQVEFVSANPTGPLHVGHGRGAAYGATVANLLEAIGYRVHREYYVNDAGRQMDILGTSVWLRYLELCGEDVVFPANGYQGDYVLDIAASLHREHGDLYRTPANTVFADLPADEPAGGDKEKYIDALIVRARQQLGDNHYRYIFETGLNYILDDIRDDLARFGVQYDEWYSERTLTESGAVNQAIERLREAGHVYEENGALWFRSTAFGDDKDRVVQRDNGQTTYFASDIAYHMDKLERGFERVIDIWGADHHGYVPRIKAALQAMGDDPARLDVLLVQFAVLYRGGEKMQMSTRSGEFVTLRQLRKEVGSDAARFFYIMRKCEQHMDFDLDLAREQSANNPMYYIQYAHARICSVFRQLEEKNFVYDASAGLAALDQLQETHEQALLVRLGRYPELLESAAQKHEPHQLAHFLRELANELHTYYNAHQFLVDDADLRNARLSLVAAARQVLANGLGLLGVSAPESM